MRKIKYLFRCIIRMDYKNMFKIAKKISKKTHKLTLFIIIDMIFCGLKYGAGYYDYQEFEFYLLNKQERKTYLTRTKNNSIINQYNDKKYFDLLDDKIKFNEKFSKYINREYMVLNDNNFKEFNNFFNKHKNIIAKIVDGEGGHGIEKFTYTNENDAKTIYKELLDKKEILIEECITQHKDVSKLYPKSVNTLRLFTFYDGKNSVVLNHVFKFGNGGITDNFSSGGMYTFTDDNGTIIVPAIDREDKIFEIHPETKEKIIGYQVPFFKEACELVCQAAKEIEEIKYIGWDVAISEKGPVIIEGNSFPGVFQIKPSFLKNQGLIPKYQKYMNIK